jgi:hypothetical protein
MTLTPIAKPGPPPASKPPVDPILLETDAGLMIETPYEWREFCDPCGLKHLAWAARPYRTVSLYEVLTSYRQYTCYSCRKPLWAPENAQTTP